MKTHTNWSYAPYRPPFIDCGDIYICRIVPGDTSITFDWLSIDAEQYNIFYRKREYGNYILAGTVTNNTTSYTITGLDTACEYEFYVEADEKKSRVRLAYCSDAIDNVVTYLHPEDTAYEFSGKYLCSPSLVRHPKGYLLASMDIYAKGYPQNLTLIYRSDDEGKTWKYVSELFPCFWGKMFIHKGDLYMMAVSTEYGDLLIGKSTDGGKTFCEPSVLLRGGNGKNGEAGVHKNPQPVIEFDGRIWNTLEWGAWRRGYHAPMVMSAPIESDLLEPESFTFSEPIKYNPEWNGLPKGNSTGNIEGCLVEYQGNLYNMMRYDMKTTVPNFGKIISYQVDTQNPEAPLQYHKCIDFPANHSKFVIRYHERSRKYYSLASRILDGSHTSARNILSLMASEDLEHWEIVRDVIDYRKEDPSRIGFQYVDFIIEGNEILYLCRTAMNRAHSFHDSNYLTFGRILL